MSDTTTGIEHEDVVSRDEFEALVERVDELESELESSRTAPTGEGLDHRDGAVLTWMDENGRRSKRQLVDLYLQVTDIQNRETAKRRAKRLERTDAYAKL